MAFICVNPVVQSVLLFLLSSTGVRKTSHIPSIIYPRSPFVIVQLDCHPCMPIVAYFFLTLFTIVIWFEC